MDFEHRRRVALKRFRPHQPSVSSHQQQQRLQLSSMAQNEASKRAASMLTIAQHKFKQVLKKEDNEARLPPVAVELSTLFLSDVDAVLKQNSPVNVQVSDYKAIDHFSWGQTNRQS
jgi:hypothetical protein